MVECEKQITACTSLEELMTLLKVSLPSLEPSRLEDVIRQAASLNITRQLDVLPAPAIPSGITVWDLFIVRLFSRTVSSKVSR